MPLLAAAQVPTGIDTSYITPYSEGIKGIINNLLVPLLMAVAFIVFLFGVYKYFIQGAADETSRTDGKQFTLWGVIGFVVILSLWGIVNLVMGTFGLSSTSSAPPPPTIWGSTNLGGNGGGGGTNLGGGGGTNLGGGGGGGNLVTMTAAQAAAYLNTQNRQMNTLCAGSLSTSNACQTAQAGYTQNYCTVYPSSSSCAGAGRAATGGVCTYSSQCGSSLVCLNGICSAQLGVGATCVNDTQCAGMLVCTSNVCANQGVTGGIAAGGDCSANAAGCSAAAPYCISGVCSTGISCPTGCQPGSMDPNACVYPNGDPCTGSATAQTCTLPEEMNYYTGTCEVPYTAPTTITCPDGSSEPDYTYCTST